MVTLPDYYRIEPPSEDLVPDVIGLLEYCASVDGDEAPTAADISRQWQLTGMKDVLLIRELTHGMIIAVAGAVPMPTNQRLYVLYNVHPDHRSSVLPAYLWKHIEKYANNIQPETINSYTLVHPISGRNMWKREVLPWYGFTVARGMWKVEKTMPDTNGQPNDPEFPPDIEVTTFVASRDLTALLTVVSESFHDEPNYELQQEWLHSVTRDGDYDPNLWFLARVNDEIIGFALCYPDHQEGIVALLGVVAGWRGRGLAMALLEKAFAEFYRRRVRTVVMHIDSEYPRPQALRVYEKAGMVEKDSLLIYEKQVRVKVVVQ